MGFVDRGGGREAKGTSLRRSKKNPGAPTTKNKSAHKNYFTPTTRATPTPPPVYASIIQSLAEVAVADPTVAATHYADVYQRVCDWVRKGVLLHVDTAVALLSRKLEDDQEGIFRRAIEEGKLAGAFCWSNEVEKQAVLLATCVQHNKLYRGSAAAAAAAVGGNEKAISSSSNSAEAKLARHVRFCDDPPVGLPPVATTGSTLPSKNGVVLYAILGVHVNSIDRVNMRLHEQWMKELEENVKHGDVVGVLSGLNLSRDHGTHYAQERLFKGCWRVAAEANLPLVLHLYAADAAALAETVNRAAELLNELLTSTTTATTTAVPEKDNSINDSNAGSAPSAVVLYNGLAALHASSAMQLLVRTHRPHVASPTPGIVTSTAARNEKNGDATTTVAGHAPAQTAKVPFYVLATAEGLVEPGATSAEDNGSNEKSCASASIGHLSALLPALVLNMENTDKSDDKVLDLSQLLIGTGSPFGTPQNFPDPYLCTLPNEPANYHYVVRTIFDAMQMNEATSSGVNNPNNTVKAVASADELAAVAFLNQLRVFFHECVDDEVAKRGEEKEQREKNPEDSDAERQRAWAASQQPAAAIAVAGLSDWKAKQDLETLLAEAAKERERVEQERLREEAAREQARNEELQEKRSRREKKKNVKANNRSNFTHFRNKDFAPRQSKREKLAHQRALEGYVKGENSSDDDDQERARACDTNSGEDECHANNDTSIKNSQRQRGSASVSSSTNDSDEDRKNDSSSSDDGDNNNAAPAADSLAAEVEMLLKEVEEKKNSDGKCTNGKGKNRKNEEGIRNQLTNASGTPPPPPALSGKGQGKKKKHCNRKAMSESEERSDIDYDDSSTNSDGNCNDAKQMTMQLQRSRRERKRQQKKKQMKGEDSDDN